MDLTAVRTALATALAPINTVTYPVTILAWVPSDPTPPCVYVQPTGITFDRAFKRGLDSYDFSICAIVPRGDDQAAQAFLDGYIASSGPRSIRDVIEAARGCNGAVGGTLGGLAHDMHLTGVDAYRWFPYGDNSFIGAEFRLTVIGLGT